MSRLKEMAANRGETPALRGGHSLCAGCGIPVIVRTVLSNIEGPVVVVSATGCLEVSTTKFPTTAWSVPWLHVAFENAAAVTSGIESAHRALVRRGKIADEPVTFVAFAGDGGTRLIQGGPERLRPPAGHLYSQTPPPAAHTSASGPPARASSS